MNCDDIAWILDERRASALSPFEKADFDAHVARCADCAAQHVASEKLESFRVEVPPLPQSLVDRAVELNQARAAAALERRARRPMRFGCL